MKIVFFVQKWSLELFSGKTIQELTNRLQLTIKNLCYRDAIEKILALKVNRHALVKVYRPFLEHFYLYVGNKDTLDIKLEEDLSFPSIVEIKIQRWKYYNHK